MYVARYAPGNDGAREATDAGAWPQARGLHRMLHKLERRRGGCKAPAILNTCKLYMVARRGARPPGAAPSRDAPAHRAPSAHRGPDAFYQNEIRALLKCRLSNPLG